MSTKDRWLLPDGVDETLPDEARRLERLRRRVLDLFATWGYELVMPPLIEYLDSLLTGVGRDLDLQTFKLTDQLTGRMMGVRPDMTPQAARIDAHYLKRTAPVRLCYLGSVLRTLPEEFGGSREPLQLGAELFGHAGAESDAEILSLMAATLRAVGIADAHVDLGHVGVFRALSQAAGLNADLEGDVFDALQRKARADLEGLLAKSQVPAQARANLAALLDLGGGAEVLERARRQYAGLPDVIRAIDDLVRVAQCVGRGVDAPTLNFDLGELSGYHYYTGVVFSAFVAGHGRAVAKGGRYDGIGRAFGRERAATGFGADLRQLARIVSEPDAPLRGVLAPSADDAGLQGEIARLRAAGERVVVGLPGSEAAVRDLGCDRALVQRDGRWVVEKI
jgi:ATP phosphoribosyltransferase regulatory subunit